MIWFSESQPHLRTCFMFGLCDMVDFMISEAIDTCPRSQDDVFEDHFLLV